MGLGFFNATALRAQDVPWVDAEGHEVVVAMVKQTYRVTGSGELRLDDDPVPVRLADVPWDPDDERSSLRYHSDVIDVKVGTDVVVVGDAVSTTPVEWIDVAIAAGEIRALVRAHGPRVYYRALTGVAIGSAAETTRVPLKYELAYGGMTADCTVVEERNPSGVGVAARDSDLVDTRAPQLEHPSRPHKTARDRHPPIGVNAVMTHWLPRRAFAGTYNAEWKEGRMPLLPEDFDARHNSVAHPSLWSARGLVPGETIAVQGMTLDGALTFELPRLPVRIVGVFHDGTREVYDARVDTIVIEPELRRVELVGRRAFRLGRGKRVLAEVRVDAA